MNILALNCGSSSVKYQLFNTDSNRRLATGLVDRIGQAGATIKHQAGDADSVKTEISCKDHGEAIEHVLKALPRDAKIDAVGHRAVHGGSKFARSVQINDEIVATLESLIPLAPLHNPPNLAGIRAAMKHLPGVPQVAVFDTAFHQTMPPQAYTYAVPHAWISDFGVRRYGFHGTSHLYVSRKVAQQLNRPFKDLKIITCHIGNGASISAVKNGECVDTSMGLTPLEGTVMGTRSGDIDPGLIPYVHTQAKMTFEQVFEALNKKSGMLGLTGYNDLRDIEAAHLKGDRRCTEALQTYAYRIRKYIGAYMAVMDGADVIVFTAGVGENSPIVREMALSGLRNLGVHLDKSANEKMFRGAQGWITENSSPVKVAVVSTNEELVIVEDTVAILRKQNPADRNFKYSFEK